MQPLNYLQTAGGIIWTAACVPIGFLLTFLAYFIINRVPAKWLCDYDEEPSEELLSGRRVKYASPSGIILSILMAVSFMLCRLQFNRGFDIYFVVLCVIMFFALMISVCDHKYTIIPDQFTVAIALLGAAISVYDIIRGFHILHFAWWSPLAGAAVGAAATLFINLLGMVIYKREGMGFGDIKLFAALGIGAGLAGTIYIFLIAIIAETVFFIIFKITGRGKSSASDEENAVLGSSDDRCDEKESDPEEIMRDESGIEESENAAGKDTCGEEFSVEDISGDETSGDAQDDIHTESEEKEPAGGNYLAFGPYIAAALIVYFTLFDLIHYLAELYMNLYK